jgi:hypothetical protein
VRVEHSGSWQAAPIVREGLLKQGSVRAAGLLHNSPQLNGDALEPKSDSTQIQPHDAVTRQKRQTVATRNLNRNHRSAAHLCKLAACRASGEIGTDALAVSPIRPLSHLSTWAFALQQGTPFHVLSIIAKHNPVSESIRERSLEVWQVPMSDAGRRSRRSELHRLYVSLTKLVKH